MRTSVMFKGELVSIEYKFKKISYMLNIHKSYANDVYQKNPTRDLS